MLGLIKRKVYYVLLRWFHKSCLQSCNDSYNRPTSSFTLPLSLSSITCHLNTKLSIHIRLVLRTHILYSSHASHLWYNINHLQYRTILNYTLIYRQLECGSFFPYKTLFPILDAWTTAWLPLFQLNHGQYFEYLTSRYQNIPFWSQYERNYFDTWRFFNG